MLLALDRRPASLRASLSASAADLHSPEVANGVAAPKEPLLSAAMLLGESPPRPTQTTGDTDTSPHSSSGEIPALRTTSSPEG